MLAPEEGGVVDPGWAVEEEEDVSLLVSAATARGLVIAAVEVAEAPGIQTHTASFSTFSPAAEWSFSQCDFSSPFHRSETLTFLGGSVCRSSMSYSY